MTSSSSPEGDQQNSGEFKPAAPAGLKEMIPPREAKVSDAEATKPSVDQQVEARMRLAKAHMDDEIGRTKERKTYRRKLFAHKKDVGVGDRVGYKQPERKPKSKLGGLASSAMDWLFGSRKG